MAITVLNFEFTLNMFIEVYSVMVKHLDCFTPLHEIYRNAENILYLEFKVE